MYYKLQTSTRLFRLVAQRVLTAGLVLVGMTDQIEDACMGSRGTVRITSCLVFGVLLYGAVILQFYDDIAHAHASPCFTTRRLCRQVYVLLYFLFGVRQLACLAVFLFKVGPASIPPVEDFQIYLVQGIAALIGIHLLAARSRRRSA